MSPYTKTFNSFKGSSCSQDEEAFLPIHSKDLSPDFARRVVGYNRLVDDLVDARGGKEGWLDITSHSATSQRYGYGRYFSFICVSGYCWFGVNHERWARNEDTPLWLWVHGDLQSKIADIGRELGVDVHDDWVPIRLKRGVEYEEVLDDVVCQLKTIARVVEARI